MSNTKQINTLPEPHSGTVLCKKKSSIGSIQIREDEFWRWMIFESVGLSKQFNTTPIQSIVSKIRLNELVLPYMQAMCAGLAFINSQESLSVLQFGLGAGAINRYLLNHTDTKYLVTLESQLEVIDLYNEFFLLSSLEKNQQNIIHYPEVSCLGKLTDDTFNIVLIDVFEVKGLPVKFCSSDLLQQINQLMDGRGVLVINLPGQNKNELEVIFYAIKRNFKYVAFSTVPGYENLVLYASNQILNTCQVRLDKLESTLDLDLFDFFNSLVYA